jgi:hypothetical protein
VAKKRSRFDVGDVFTVPLDEGRVGVGQAVAKYEWEHYYYFAIFESAYPRSALPNPREIVANEVAFLALSMDTKPDWQVIGNEPVPVDMPLPACKEVVGTPDRIDVVDYSGQDRRRATPEEVELLPYREIVSPAVLEGALRARFGLEPWNPGYDELQPNEATTTARLFG